MRETMMTEKKLRRRASIKGYKWQFEKSKSDNISMIFDYLADQRFVDRREKVESVTPNYISYYKDGES